MSSLSIQDRIRALAAADQADVVMATEPVHDDGQPDEPVAESVQQVPKVTKRSSVIDMWRKREESVVSPQKAPLPPRKSTGSVAALSPIGVNNTPIVAENSPSYKFEEKKEATRDEKPPLTVQTSVKNRWTNSAASPAKNNEVCKPNDVVPDVPESPAGSVSGDAEGSQEIGTPGSRTKVRSIWKQRETTGSSELQGATSFGSGTSGPGSQTPRGSVLDRWNKRAQAQDESDAVSTPTVDVIEAPAPIPPASPVVKASTPRSTAPSSPAFSDLKSKWAKFGVENVESRQDASRPPSQPSTPTVAASPKVVKTEEVPTPDPSKVKVEVPLPKEAENKSAKETEAKDRKNEPPPVSNQSKAHQHATSVRRARQAMLKKEQLRKMGHGVGTKSTAAVPPVVQPPVEEEPGQIPATPEVSTTTPVPTGSPARVAPSTPNAPSVGAKKAASYANSASPPRQSPRKFAQRKMLFDKHRQRSNVTPENEDGDNVEPQTVSEEPVAIENAEISNTLSDAFKDVGTDAQREALSQNLASPRQADAPTPQDHTTVSLNHLLAHGANEGDLVENELDMPIQNEGNSEYSSLQVSDSFSKQSSSHLLSPKEGSLVNSVLSDGADGGASVEDQLSAIGSTVSAKSKGSIVQRAQQSLREKRNKNRHLEEEQNGVEQELSDFKAVDNDQQPDVSEPHTKAEDFHPEVATPSKYVLTSDPYPQDELMGSMPSHPAKTAPTSTASRRQTPSSAAVDTTFDSETASSTSNVISMDSSGYSNSETLSNSGMVLNGTGLAAHADAFLADKFVAESENNVEAFASSFKAMSIGQMALDLHQEVASSLTGVDFNKISTELNEGMAAASDSLNRLVGAKVFSARVVPQRQPSPIEEEVAIEVEYVEDSESEDED